MSEQRNPTTTAQPDEARARKASRDKAAPLTLAGFPVGHWLVADYRYQNGFIVHLYCQIIEVYESRELAEYDNHGLVIFAKVGAVDSERMRYLLGHTVRLSLASEGTWWLKGPRWTRRPFRDFPGPWIEASK